MPNLVAGAKIFELCGKQFTLEGLKDACGISKPYLCMILQGKRKAPVKTLRRIAQALDSDIPRLSRELEIRNHAQEKPNP